MTISTKSKTMLNYNDAWLMEKSLSLYLSTNTFSNPAFDAQDNEQVSDELDENPPERRQQEDESNANDRIEKPESQSSAKKRNSFRDDLVFSVKCKLFVLELNYKKRLQRLRRFVTQRLPWILPENWSSRRHRTADMYNDEWSKRFDSLGFGIGIGKASWLKEDKFWRNFEPDSRQALDLQGEKILSRLERALQTNKDSGGQQQQQQRLFNMSSADSMSHIDTDEMTLQRCKPTGPVSPSCHLKFSARGEAVAVLRKKNCKNKVGSEESGLLCSWRSNPEAKEGFSSQESTSSASNSRNSEKVCIVCYVNQPDIVTLPCKHNDTCSDCFIRMIYRAVKHSQYPLKCVLCRQKIERIRYSRQISLNGSREAINGKKRTISFKIDAFW